MVLSGKKGKHCLPGTGLPPPWTFSQTVSTNFQAATHLHALPERKRHFGAAHATTPRKRKASGTSAPFFLKPLSGDAPDARLHASNQTLARFTPHELHCRAVHTLHFLRRHAGAGGNRRVPFAAHDIWRIAGSHCYAGLQRTWCWHFARHRMARLRALPARGNVRRFTRLYTIYRFLQFRALLHAPAR